MAKKILGGLGLGGKKKAAAPVATAAPKVGPIITPLGGAAPAVSDPRRRRSGRPYSTILGGLNQTLGGG